MRICKHCKKAFAESRKGDKFCNQKCKNQFNVYKKQYLEVYVGDYYEIEENAEHIYIELNCLKKTQ